MGVLGLWKLLAPAGRQVDIASLRGKVVAVDMSIWLVRFIKAMRDAEGNMEPNAHIVGTFGRVCKLLFHRIRPIFVFDGGTPALKRRTLLLRAQRRAGNEDARKRTVQRLLLLQLERQRAQSKLAQRAPKERLVASAFTAETIKMPASVSSNR